MKKLIICNTQFEWELAQKKVIPLESTFLSHPIYRLLQFLAFLYAKEEDVVLCTEHPEPTYFDRLRSFGLSPPHYMLLQAESMRLASIDAWGSTASLQHWADQHQHSLSMPAWPIIKQVQSKVFCFHSCPILAHTALIESVEQAQHWVQSFSGKKVLKMAYGLSARGHIHIVDSLTPKDIKAITNELAMGHPLVGQPWVERLLDFSTQWLVDKDGSIDYLGATLCKNNERGSYQKSMIFPEDSIGKENDPFLKEHKDAALSTLTMMQNLGYYGHVGIDAMIFNEQGRRKLHPVVEINARKTMGWLALQMQRKICPDALFSLSFTESNEKSLLPTFSTSVKGVISPFYKGLKSAIFPANTSWKDIYF